MESNSGGIFLAPTFVFLFDLPQKNAVAASLAAIILTSVTASLRTSDNPLAHWKIAVPVALSAARQRRWVRQSKVTL